MNNRLSVYTGALAAMCVVTVAAQLFSQDSGAAMRNRLRDNADDFWIYDDIEAGYSLASQTGKPMLVSFRCVP